MPWTSERPVADFVQVNIYGVTLNDLLHRGVNIPYLLSLYGLDDCVVVDIPRRNPCHRRHYEIGKASWTIQLNSTVKPDFGEPGLLCSTPRPEGRHVLMDCSLSTIRSASDDRFLESGGGFEEFSEPSFGGPAPVAHSSYEDTIPNFPPHASTEIEGFPSAESPLHEDTVFHVPSFVPPEVAEMLKKVVDEVVETEDHVIPFEECSMARGVGFEEDEETEDPLLALANSAPQGDVGSSADFGGLPEEQRIPCPKSHSLSLFHTQKPTSPLSPRRTASGPGRLPFSADAPLIKRSSSILSQLAHINSYNADPDVSVKQSPSFVEQSAAVAAITQCPVKREEEEDDFCGFAAPPASPRCEDDEFFDCSGGFDHFEDMAAGDAADVTMNSDTGYGEDMMSSPGNPVPTKKRRKPVDASIAKELTCQFENCGMGIRWKPNYGRQRMLDHVRSKHWKKKTWKCAFCSHKVAVEIRIMYHHKKKHPGEEYVKPVNCETKEETEAQLALWEKCFPGTPIPSQLFTALQRE